ncbi:MAG: two component transcriptional regulator, LuxR family [Actinomycetia bacterium]|nr:two component transcriptional regulator, LuxR family [Actinomycetes bacterium]
MPSTERLATPVRVLMADDHPVLLQGLRRSLELDGGFEIVGEAYDGAQVLPLIRRTSPDVVLLDMHMPGIDGIGCIARIRRAHPEVKVVMCSMESATDQVEAAFLAGACGYVVKTVDPRDLAPAIRQAVAGTAFQPVGVTTSDDTRIARSAGLTCREIEILRCVARGKSNKTIGRELWVTEQTVKFHLSNIFRKLSVTNRTEAARWAFSKGLHESTEALANVR